MLPHVVAFKTITVKKVAHAMQSASRLCPLPADTFVWLNLCRPRWLTLIAATSIDYPIVFSVIAPTGNYCYSYALVCWCGCDVALFLCFFYYDTTTLLSHCMLLGLLFNIGL